MKDALDLRYPGFSVGQFRYWYRRDGVWVELIREESLGALEKAKAQNGCKS